MKDYRTAILAQKITLQLKNQCALEDFYGHVSSLKMHV